MKFKILRICAGGSLELSPRGIGAGCRTRVRQPRQIHAGLPYHLGTAEGRPGDPPPDHATLKVSPGRSPGESLPATGETPVDSAA